MNESRWLGVRLGGLFTRLLLAQTILAFVVSIVSISFYYFERNKTVAYILADQWAPSLMATLSRPTRAPHPGIYAEHEAMPASALETVSWWPHVRALKRALGDKGIDANKDGTVTCDEVKAFFDYYVANDATIATDALFIPLNEEQKSKLQSDYAALSGS